jgi:hypothetical protein
VQPAKDIVEKTGQGRDERLRLLEHREAVLDAIGHLPDLGGGERALEANRQEQPLGRE